MVKNKPDFQRAIAMEHQISYVFSFIFHIHININCKKCVILIILTFFNLRQCVWLKSLKRTCPSFDPVTPLLKTNFWMLLESTARKCRTQKNNMKNMHEKSAS